MPYLETRILIILEQILVFLCLIRTDQISVPSPTINVIHFFEGLGFIFSYQKTQPKFPTNLRNQVFYSNKSSNWYNSSLKMRNLQICQIAVLAILPVSLKKIKISLNQSTLIYTALWFLCQEELCQLCETFRYLRYWISQDNQGEFLLFYALVLSLKKK